MNRLTAVVPSGECASRPGHHEQDSRRKNLTRKTSAFFSLSLPLACMLILLLLAATPVAAGTVIQTVEGEADLTAPAQTPLPADALTLIPRLDIPANLLLAPYFVDPSTGDTTLFAFRNTSTSTVDVTVGYYGLNFFAGPQFSEVVSLAPRATRTVNIRDKTGDLDLVGGVYRGFVRIFTDDDSLTGDYFQVDLGEDFATGDRMVTTEDFCQEHEIRFLQGGVIDGGTELTMVLNFGSGGDPMTDPPSVTVRTYTEGGTLLSTSTVFTDFNLVVLNASQLTSAPFGVFEIEINGGGSVNATYSAAGKFSIGLNAACTDDPMS